MKTTNRPYINTPFREPEVFPWRTTHIDIVGPLESLLQDILYTKD